MRRILFTLFFALTLACAARSADMFPAFDDDTPQGDPIPYRVIPMEDFAAFVKNWSDASLPHYAIITNIPEWQSVFSPAATMGNNKPFQPDPAIFNEAVLIAISRVSEAPAPGEKVLVVKSFLLSNGEPIMTYSFIPPPRRGGSRAKNTLLVMIPARYIDGLRFIEETETPESLAAARELEAARAAGLFKPPALPNQPMPGQQPQAPRPQQPPQRQPMPPPPPGR